jgi:hypothetical protein
VTELVCDASTYSKTTAEDWDQYIEDCERASRNLEDEAWLDRQRRAHNIREQLASFCQSQSLVQGSGFLRVGSDNGDILRNALDGPVPPTLANSNALHIGCNTTFLDHGQYYADQQWIREKGVDTCILTSAITRFPRFHRVVSTDYRSLAREGESYAACCRRLSGKTLEPQHTGVDEPDEGADDCLFFLLDVLAKAPDMRIDSLP